MSTTDDLIALGCGAAVGKLFFWGLILTLGFVFTHPWVLLIGLAIWWLVKKYGTEPAPAAASSGSAHRTLLEALPCGDGATPSHRDREGGRASGLKGLGMTDGGLESAGTNALVCLTWNLGRRSHPEQVRVVGSANADIVALQEVAAQHQPALTQGLGAQGLVHLHGGPNAARSFSFTSLIASRWPMRPVDTHGLDVTFPERVQRSSSRRPSATSRW